MYKINERKLFRAGAAGLWGILLYALVTMVLLPLTGAQPETAAECLELLHTHRLLGLIRLDILTVIIMPLFYLVYFAVYRSLRDTGSPFGLFFTALLFVGVTLFLATPSALPLASLSDQYYAADNEQVRQAILAAATALRAGDMWHMTGAVMGSLLTQIAAIGLSAIMMRSPVYGKKLGVLGIVTHGLDLLHFVCYILAMETVSTVLISIAGVLYLPLYAWTALKLVRINGE